MASQKSRRQSRKRRRATSAPRAVASPRREQQAGTAHTARRAARPGALGERPPGPFGGFPVSEIAILAGLVALVFGLVESATAPLITGSVVCGLGVVEVTAREHFAGYRSHTVLLAAIPAVALEAGLSIAFGAPKPRGLLLLVVLPVFGILFLFFKRRFEAARQTRLARPPGRP